MKFAFVADLHLSRYGQDKIEDATQLPERLYSIKMAWNNMVGYCRQNDITKIIIGGDCLHGKSVIYAIAQGILLDFFRDNADMEFIVIDGNHDSNNGTKTPIESVNIDHGGIRIHLTHNPKHANEDYKFNYCGHCHGNEGTFRKLGRKSVIVDISLENWDYCPITINDVNGAYSAWLKGGKRA